MILPKIANRSVIGGWAGGAFEVSSILFFIADNPSISASSKATFFLRPGGRVRELLTEDLEEVLLAAAEVDAAVDSNSVSSGGSWFESLEA